MPLYIRGRKVASPSTRRESEPEIRLGLDAPLARHGLTVLNTCSRAAFIDAIALYIYAHALARSHVRVGRHHLLTL